MTKTSLIIAAIRWAIAAKLVHWSCLLMMREMSAPTADAFTKLAEASLVDMQTMRRRSRELLP